MGMVDVASGKSIWRGMDYYEQHKVLEWEKLDETHYKGRVAGNEGKIYEVTIDTAHPKRSKCDCPFAEGRYVVCKHMIALYFTAEPWQAEQFWREVEEAELEEEEKARLHKEELERYVKSLSKKALQEQLLEALLAIEELEREAYW